MSRIYESCGAPDEPPEGRARKATRSMIAGATVDSTTLFIVYGSVRGIVSRHFSIRAAFASLERDRRGCERQGGYSDACGYMASEGSWVQCDEEAV